MRFLILLLAGLLPVAVSADEYQPRNTQAPGEEPPTPEEAAAAITVPDGFQVTLFAGEPDVRQPVAMAMDGRGRLWVAESYSYKEWEQKGEDRILIFEDTDNDGRHDSRQIFWDQGKHVSGMTVGWGGVWVCDSPNLLFIPDRDGDGVPDGEPEIVLDGWTTKGGHNFFNGLTWGIDGWLYGRHGITAPSKVGVLGTPDEERAEFDCSIWRYHPVTKKFEVVCRGTTNPWGLDWNADGELFFTNNVNGHLWHAIQGAFYPRMGERDDPFVEHVYERIPMAADHLHHAGTIGDWTKTRDGKGVHGELGGGHSHCGGMIYQGGKWPAQYHGKMFMCNTHGRRINVDSLTRRGSGYVAEHEADFMQANQPWFRGVQLLYGPDGDVYVSDWTDLGECHDNDGVHRTSGRIYKIIYGEPSEKPEIDLTNASQDELIGYQLDDNEWYARMARQVLQMRAVAGELKDPEKITSDLRKVFAVHPSEAVRLRLILTLHVTGLLPPSSLNDLIHDDSEFVRAWTIRLCTEPPYSEDTSVQIPVNPNDPSLLVRLAWASQLQQANFEGVGWRVAEQLARDPAIADDPNLPLMIYYGVKDRVAEEPEKALGLLRETTLPILRRSIARRFAEAGDLDSLNSIFEFLSSAEEEAMDEMALENILTGVAEGLEGKREITRPTAWNALNETLTGLSAIDPMKQVELPVLQAKLGLIFDRTKTLATIRGQLQEVELAFPYHNDFIGLIGKVRDRDSIPVLLDLSGNKQLGSAAIRALAAFNDSKIADQLLEKFPEFSEVDQSAVVNALSGNPRSAAKLLDAIEAETIPRHAITAYHARQIQNFKDQSDLKKRLAKVWGTFKQSSGEKKELIKSWQNQLLPDVLAKADLENGHAKFQQLCMACHTLHGEGVSVGPDLTGANRSDVYYLLENIIDPSATLPQDFRLTVIEKKDGTVVSGNVIKENEYAVTLRLLDREETVNTEDIAKRQTLEQSLMPEGLLTVLKPDEVRDLIGFLQQ